MLVRSGAWTRDLPLDSPTLYQLSLPVGSQEFMNEHKDNRDRKILFSLQQEKHSQVMLQSKKSIIALLQGRTIIAEK